MGERPSQYHTFNYFTKTWVDARDIEQVRAAQLALITFYRNEAEYGGFTWNGNVFDSDAPAVSRIGIAARQAALNASFEIDWTLQDNSIVTLDQTDMLAVDAALALHIATQHATSQSLKAAINAATTIAAIHAIVWPA